MRQSIRQMRVPNGSHAEREVSMRRRIAILMAGCMLLGITGCGNQLSPSTKNLTIGGEKKQTKDSETDLSEETEKQTKSVEENPYYYENFAVNLLQHVYKTGENVMISPFSILEALTMTENGAKGDTLTQMEQTLARGLSAAEQSAFLTSYQKSLSDSENARMNVANSIWVKNTDDRLHIKDDFLQLNEEQFGAEIFSAPFDENTLSDINRWVSDKTENMIPKMLEKIGDDAVMYLINAVAFDAKWQEEYEDYQVRNQEFTREDGTVEQAKLMYSEEPLYIEDEDTTGFIKYYKENYAFVALLPQEGMSMEEYVNGLTGEKFVGLIETARSDVEVHAAIPKFSSEYTVELSEVLPGMGMTDAFDGDRADFTGIGTVDDGNLYISMVLHKTYIQVDELGTKAGAATAVAVAETAALVEEEIKDVILDRPFVYAVIDTTDSHPVFLGVTESVAR